MTLSARCRFLIGAIVSTIVAGAALYAVQEPPRDSAAGRLRGTGALLGTIVGDDANAEPVRQAIVTLNAPGVAETTTTDDRGAFAFEGLPAGRFTLSASKPAYLTSAWGATRPNGPGTPIVLSTGEGRSGLTLRLARGAVLTGQVRDQFGQPAAFQTVLALELRWVDGRRVLRPVDADSVPMTHGPAATGYHAGMSDDRGIYRLFGLPPGEYLVVVRYGQSVAAVARHQTNREDIARAEALLRASSSRGAPSALSQPAASAAASGTVPQSDVTGFAPVYYPGTLVAGDAGKVRLGLGEERTGLDVALQAVRTATIRGNIVDASGRPASNVLIQLVSVDPGLGPGQSYGDSRPASGQFSLSNVPPGHYRLEARSVGATVAGEPTGWAEREVTIDGRDVPDVTLTLAPSLVIHGRVGLAQSRAESKSAEPATFTLTPVEGLTASWTRALKATSKDGAFAFENVTPGKYWLTCSVSSGSIWVDSMTVGGSNVADEILDVRPSQPLDEIVATLRDDPTRLTGSLQDTTGSAASGFSVVVFSASRADWHWQSRRVRETRLGDDGTFSFVGLPPGDYWLAVLNGVEANQWFDPEFLEAALPGAVKVTLRPGQTTVQRVRIAGQ